MSEATLWRYLRDGLRPLRVDLCRHEDIAAVGVPDVSYGARGVQGWIELKQVKRWTRNGVKVPWRPGQQEWLKRRWSTGNRSWLLIRVGRENFIFLADRLPPDKENWTKDEYNIRCTLCWETGEDVWSELLEVLTR